MYFFFYVSWFVICFYITVFPPFACPGLLRRKQLSPTSIFIRHSRHAKKAEVDEYCYIDLHLKLYPGSKVRINDVIFMKASWHFIKLDHDNVLRFFFLRDIFFFFFNVTYRTVFLCRSFPPPVGLEAFCVSSWLGAAHSGVDDELSQW